jgi:hypothetical protein
MKIPQEMDDFREQLENLVKSLEQKHNVNIVFNTMRFDGDGTKFNCTMSVVNKEIDGKSVEQVMFEKNCNRYGFVSTDYKAKVTLRGEDFELVGFNTRKPKNNCKIVSLATGKVYGTNSVHLKTKIR